MQHKPEAGEVSSGRNSAFWLAAAERIADRRARLLKKLEGETEIHAIYKLQGELAGLAFAAELPKLLETEADQRGK